MSQNSFEHKAVLMNAFTCLSECYFQPEQALEETIEKLSTALTPFIPKAAEFAADMLTTLKGSDIMSLKVDHAALFMGPYRLLAPPYGSVYLEEQRKVMGDSTMDVLEHYRGAGMEISQYFTEPPDHVVAELEFMAYLFYKEVEARQAGIISDAEFFQQEQTAFFRNHLGAWIDRFAARIREEASSDFYRHLAGCTISFADYVRTVLFESAQPDQAVGANG